MIKELQCNKINNTTKTFNITIKSILGFYEIKFSEILYNGF